MEDNNRPPIPPGIKRQVRQKCEFACVMCGNPVCDVDHIDNYSVVQEHELDNLTLLCTMHHRLKTNKILSPEVVRERTNNITHARGGLPDLNFAECKLMLGNNPIHSIKENAFEIHGKDYFRIGYDNELKQVIINAAFYDRNNKVAFKIVNNTYSTTNDAYDVEVVGNRIIFREGPNKIYLIVTLDGINNVIHIHGKIFINEVCYLRLNNKGIHCNGHTIADNMEFQNCDRGIFIAEDAIIEQVHAAVRGMASFKNGGFQYFRVAFAFSTEEIMDAFNYSER